ncbi:MAG: cytochrome P450 [Myxococcales bacterium]|nr:cytochrome P450 [Myxococcales bacterium]
MRRPFALAAAGYLGALRLLNGARRAGEPPLVRGWLPYLGCAPAFGRDAPGFLERCRARCGSVFTLVIAGKRMTFLLDARDFEALIKEPKRLSFYEIKCEIGSKAFGYRRPDESPIDNDALEGMYGEHLKPSRLHELSRALLARLREDLDARDDPGEDAPARLRWRNAELYEFISRLMFDAGAAALYGEDFPSDEVYARFVAFDKRFPLIVAGVPLRFLSGVADDRAWLVQHLSRTRESMSQLMWARHGVLSRQTDARERGQYALSLLWASQANTVPAAFWSVAYLLRDARALAAVREELAAGGADDPARRSGERVWTRDELDSMRLLDSCICEALRLSSASMVLRRVTESHAIPLVSGATARVREGDLVCLFPYLSHRDPEIFEAPNEYRFDRFVRAQGVARFEKRGERVPFAYLPYGAGASMCPGRFWAHREIKLLIATLLTAYEFDVPRHALPPLDQRRAGLGILPPDGDLRVRLRRRRRR